MEIPQEDSWNASKRFLVLFAAATALLAGVAVTHYYVAMKTERIGRETSELLNVELVKPMEKEKLIKSVIKAASQHSLFEGPGKI